MPTFKDLKSLFAHVKKNSNQVLRNDIANLGTETMRDTVEEETYAYTPTEYERRERDGGLADTRNYTVEVIGDDSISITNDTTGNEDYAPPNSDGWDEGTIDHIIVSGQGYHWKRSKMYKNKPSRDFYSGTSLRLKNGNLLNNTFKVAMRRKGFDLK